VIAFELSEAQHAVEPPEARGLARDQVRLLVAGPGAAGVRNASFREIGRFLRPGDLLVVNDSETLPAALDAVRSDGTSATVHLASELPDGRWTVELRPAGAAGGPVDDASAGERVLLPTGAVLTLRRRYPQPDSRRLWVADVAVEADVQGYLRRFGRPVTYAYVRARWPLAAYQTVFARRPGSAEMPSAGRPFSAELVTGLVSAGVLVAPLTLHTGLSSPEPGEPPTPEPYSVPASTARLVDLTRRHGGRVVAVGTTVVRALETVADPGGGMHAGAGWTDLVLGRERRARVVDALVTGWHAPGASHLDLLEAVVGEQRVSEAYRQALDEGYLWHEFGDSALLFR
jgi:S-adenosylmethionine:tRNA ribosyltransferase-isomerase